MTDNKEIKEKVLELNNNKIAGLLPFSSIEYPNKLASVVFFKGCNFNCDFCYNNDLIPVPKPSLMVNINVKIDDRYFLRCEQEYILEKSDLV